MEKLYALFLSLLRVHKIRDFIDAKKRFFWQKPMAYKDRAAIIRKRTSPLIFKFSKKCYSKENPFIHILDSINAETRKGRCYYGISKNREHGIRRQHHRPRLRASRRKAFFTGEGNNIGRLRKRHQYLRRIHARNRSQAEYRKCTRQPSEGRPYSGTYRLDRRQSAIRYQPRPSDSKALF